MSRVRGAESLVAWDRFGLCLVGLVWPSWATDVVSSEPHKFADFLVCSRLKTGKQIEISKKMDKVSEDKTHRSRHSACQDLQERIMTATREAGAWSSSQSNQKDPNPPGNNH